MNSKILSEITEVISEMVPVALGVSVSAIALHTFNETQLGAVLIGFNGVHIGFEEIMLYLAGGKK